MIKIKKDFDKNIMLESTDLHEIISSQNSYVLTPFESMKLKFMLNK